MPPAHGCHRDRRGTWRSRRSQAHSWLYCFRRVICLSGPLEIRWALIWACSRRGISEDIPISLLRLQRIDSESSIHSPMYGHVFVPFSMDEPSAVYAQHREIARGILPVDEGGVGFGIKVAVRRADWSRRRNPPSRSPRWRIGPSAPIRPTPN
jgi:hypothetical protein